MRKKDATITAWLRNRISHLDYGLKWRGGVVHCNTNETVLEHLRSKSRLSHLTNEKLSRHFSGTDTFYFAGNSWDDETLVLIDIDCHDGVGSLQGAFAYAQFLKDTFFPNLYFEPSTNGKGVHGYFVLDKKDVRPETVNDLLGQLQVVLRQTTTGFDIQTVEIKGRCPVVIWGRRRGEVANYKAGTLAKIPRQAERFEELKNTTRLAVKDLIALVPRLLSPFTAPTPKIRPRGHCAYKSREMPAWSLSVVPIRGSSPVSPGTLQWVVGNDTVAFSRSRGNA